MPVRSLSSSVLRWPDKAAVDRAVRQWVRRENVQHPELLRAGYFGSYARGQWGVGSDVDLLLIVAHANRSWPERSLDWNTEELPVPAELLVYTTEEWQRLQRQGGRFAESLAHETVWILPGD